MIWPPPKAGGGHIRGSVAGHHQAPHGAWLLSALWSLRSLRVRLGDFCVNRLGNFVNKLGNFVNGIERKKSPKSDNCPFIRLEIFLSDNSHKISQGIPYVFVQNSYFRVFHRLFWIIHFWTFINVQKKKNENRT